MQIAHEELDPEFVKEAEARRRQQTAVDASAGSAAASLPAGLLQQLASMSSQDSVKPGKGGSQMGTRSQAPRGALIQEMPSREGSRGPEPPGEGDIALSGCGDSCGGSTKPAGCCGGSLGMTRGSAAKWAMAAASEGSVLQTQGEASIPAAWGNGAQQSAALPRLPVEMQRVPCARGGVELQLKVQLPVDVAVEAVDVLGAPDSLSVMVPMFAPWHLAEPGFDFEGGVTCSFKAKRRTLLIRCPPA